MQRRAVVIGLLAGALAPAPVRAQSSLPRVGWLDFGSPTSSGHLLQALKEGLAELGWRERNQYVLELRWANGRIESLDALARELAAVRPAVMVGGPSQVVRALVKAAPRTPVVHATGADPVGAGFAASLARPGGMVTGLANAMTDLSSKYLEVLVDAVPAVRRVGCLLDATNIHRARIAASLRQSIERLGIGAELAEIGTAGEIEAALARFARAGVQGLVIMPSPLFRIERRTLVAAALVRRWPAVGPVSEFAEAGALLSYGHDVTVNYRRSAQYVDRILKGAKPGELPMEEPTRIELVVNLATAKALGIAVSPAVLVRADRVLQ